MTTTAERPRGTEPEVSVASRSLADVEGVNSMIASTAFDRDVPRRARPSGLDRLVMRASLAALLWARRHADRSTVPRDEQLRRYRVQAEVRQREHAALLLARLY